MDSTVGGIDQWYFEECKFREIAKHQLAFNISEKKKTQRRLLRNLANTSSANQATLIEFHRVGRDEQFRYEKVAKEIADKVKGIEDDEARLPRHLTFHLPIESQRQAAAK